jgi:hypothetical protein
MMYVIEPVRFTPSMLVSTTAAETTPLWVSGTHYAKDAEVRWQNTYGDWRLWKSLVSTNTSTPGTSGNWLDIGPANNYAMFDRTVSTQTEALSPLVVLLAPGEVVSNLTLINLIGTAVKVEMLDGATVVYEKTVNLSGAESADWWDYYFTVDEQVTSATFDDLPLYYSGQIRITLTGGGAVAIGHTVFGTRHDLGNLKYGASSGIIDYSKKVTDEFGVTEFVQRAWADEFSGTIEVGNFQLNSLKRLMQRIRSTPCLWVGHEDDQFRETLIVFGWYRSHRIAIAYPNHSLLDLEIEGLV